MIEPGGRETLTVISQLVNQIIYEENILQDWKDSVIINCYKGKGNATDPGTYRALKLLEHVMKVLEHVLGSLTRSQVDINNIQFDFMPGCSTTDAIYILQQMQEKHLINKRKIYFTFVDLVKAIDWLTCSILWCAMRKLGIDEWIVRLVKVMYHGANSRVRVKSCFSERFQVM